MKPLNSLILATILCFFNITLLFAQPSFEYKPVKDDSLELLSLQKAIRAQFEKDSLSINGENKKYILAIYKDRFREINELFEDKEPIAAAEVNTFLTGIASEVVNKNPDLKKLAPRIIFSRAYWPNAYSTGEGTIVFNIDLFVKLQNESQVAFVLCHELAHLFLDHSNKKISKYISTVYSDDFQQKLKELKKQQYDKKAELDKLEMGIAFKSFRHSRDFESEADSAGLKFLKNTRYDCKEALSCLALLDEIDEEKIDFTMQLPKVFSFSEYPFKKRWLEKEAAFFGVTADNKEKKPIDDSLKTHPDCKVRIKTLTPLFEQLHLQGGQQFVQNQQLFNQLQQQFAFEETNYCFTKKHVSKSLFNAICLLDKHPGNAYLVTLAGKCFNEFYEKQKNHHLNNIVDRPSPFKEKNYNTLLEFISRLSLTDISSLGYNFMKQYSGSFEGNEDFKKVFEQSKKNYEEATKN
ncbi:MAG: M48 family metalloprotease [Chitinophagaceae bacterium]|nr:M48 family metalloprotease [Chitinophagaceae bacterium]